jgi:hypothetical protein
LAALARARQAQSARLRWGLRLPGLRNQGDAAAKALTPTTVVRGAKVVIIPRMITRSLEILEKAQLPPAQARAILEVMEPEFTTGSFATKDDLRTALAPFPTKAELFEVKAELMRWMFVFWAGQIAATLAIVKFLK